jgi:hypothetical protein
MLRSFEARAVCGVRLFYPEGAEGAREDIHRGGHQIGNNRCMIDEIAQGARIRMLQPEEILAGLVPSLGVTIPSEFPWPL